MAPSTSIRALAILGSLRKGSYNAMALRAACALQPEGLTLERADIAEIPPYDEDLRQAGFPAPVQRLREGIAAAQAVLFVTPEYNYSIPGFLKNAIDWASRPPDQPFAGKAVAIMGVSSGASGTVRAQHHLRQICVYLDMHPINKPEVAMNQAAARFDADGRLTNAADRDLIGVLLRALRDWARRLN